MMKELSIAQQAEDDPVITALKDAQVRARLWNAARALLGKHCRNLSSIERTQETNGIVQEAILRALQRRQKFDQGKCALLWLIGFVRNVAREFSKKKKRQISVTSPDGPGIELLAVDPSRSVEDILADKQLADRLMDELPELDRQLLTMNVCEGKTNAEIGLHIGMNENTVRVRIHRAKEKLRAKADPAREGRP